MLYYQFQNYDGFKHLFGSVNRSNGTCGRKNKILLAYIKDKKVLHEAAANNQYDHLHLSDIAGMERIVEQEIFKSGKEDGRLLYELRLMGQVFHSASYETDENEGLCEDGDMKAVRYVNRKNGKVFKMKAGKLYRSLILETEFGKRLPEQVVTHLSEKFAAEWQAYAIGKQPKMEVYVNRDFKRIYSSEYCEGEFDSCMMDEDYYDFYKNAVDANAAYIENKDGKIIARCIIYNKVEDQDGKVWRLAERQYASNSNDALKRTLVNLLVEGGYIDGYKKVGAGCGDARAFVSVTGESLSDRKFRIRCDLDYEEPLSYQDSFKYYDESSRKADNYGSGSISLDITNGCIEDNEERCYDDYHDYHCRETRIVYVHGREYDCDENNLDDFIWIDMVREYHHEDDVSSCEECDEYYLKENCCHSEITGKEYCCQECMEKAEKRHKEENWYYSDYDKEYFEEEEDIAYYRRWNREQEEYEEKTISVTSLNRLLYGDEFFQFGDLYFNEVNPATNLPYGYKLVKMEE